MIPSLFSGCVALLIAGCASGPMSAANEEQLLRPDNQSIDAFAYKSIFDAYKLASDNMRLYQSSGLETEKYEMCVQVKGDPMESYPDLTPGPKLLALHEKVNSFYCN